MDDSRGDRGKVELSPILSSTTVAERYFFDSTITKKQKEKLIERYNIAYNTIDSCVNLNSDEKSALKITFNKVIMNYQTTKSDVNG